MAIGDIQKFSFIVEDAEMIAELITRSAIFEQIYLYRESATTANLRQALSKLYNAVVLYLSEARKYFKDSSLSKSFYGYS
jgi:hypothetical protein